MADSVKEELIKQAIETLVRADMRRAGCLEGEVEMAWKPWDHTRSPLTPPLKAVFKTLRSGGRERFVVLAGQTGAGKTMLAAKMLRIFAEQRIRAGSTRCKWLNESRAVAHIRAERAASFGWSQLEDDASMSDHMVVIDDLGSSKESDILHGIVMRRYEGLALTIVTTNEPGKLPARLQSRAHGNLIEVPYGDYREL